MVRYSSMIREVLAMMGECSLSWTIHSIILSLEGTVTIEIEIKAISSNTY
jgi:hypothetical protein